MGQVTLNRATAVFKPLPLLQGATTYIATVTSDTQDLLGNALNQVHTWRFTTAGANSPGSKDDKPPIVISIKPNHGAKKISTRTSISVRFSEEIDPARLARAFSVLIRVSKRKNFGSQEMKRRL